MLQSIPRFAVCMALVLTAACASKTPLQTEGLASTGKQYTSTLKKVNSFALDHTLEFTAGLLPNLPRDNTTLLAQTQAMQQRAALLQTTSDTDTTGWFSRYCMIFSALLPFPEAKIANLMGSLAMSPSLVFKTH